MRTLIQRYLAANFIIPLMGSSVFFVFFLLTFQMFRMTKMIISKDVPVMEVLSLLSNIAISFIPMAIPLAVLFSLIFSLGRLSEDSEIVAARSFGLSRNRLFLPFLIVGILMAVIVYALNIQVIPNAKKEFKSTIVKLTSSSVLSNIKPEQFFTEIPGITLYSETVDGDGKILGNVFIHSGEKENAAEQVIFAKRGVLVKHGQEGTLNMRLHLFDGNIVKTKTDVNQVEKILFQEYDFPVFQSDMQVGTVEKDSVWPNNKLVEAIKTQKADLQAFREIKKKRELGQDEKDSENRLKGTLSSLLLEYWSRINNAFQVLAFTFLGFGLGIKQGRGKSRNTGAIALATLIGYYAILFFLISLAKKSHFNPAMANFIPTILVMMLGTYYYKKFDWHS